MEASLRTLDATIAEHGGVLRVHATLVPTTFFPVLNRLGLEDPSAGSRGVYGERRVGSSFPARGHEGLSGEGINDVELSDGQTAGLAEVMQERGDVLLGAEYAAAHNGRFGLLAKVVDIGETFRCHFHAHDVDAKRLWNSLGKEEAHFYLETDDLGPRPYSHLGFHPDVTREDLLPALEDWCDDRVVDLEPGYRLNVGEGFHLKPGVPHAPGTALIIELQQESNVINYLQGASGSQTMDKSWLYSDLPDEMAVLDLINWEEATRPDFYSHYHNKPAVISDAAGAREVWAFHPKMTHNFSGKELRLTPGAQHRSRENGAYALMAWKGQGTVADVPVQAGDLKRDELFVGFETATADHVIKNTGHAELVVYKLFGPNVNTP